ncbi:hypothetical protein [Vibrio sp.]|uniref:hypothetical protein n=1 Tax=Vibrio sp. TaxID=678 RepID=UPI003787C1D4
MTRDVEKDAKKQLDRVANFTASQGKILDNVYHQQQQQLGALNLQEQLGSMQNDMSAFFDGMHANIQGAVDGLKQNLDEYERNQEQPEEQSGDQSDES